MERVRFIEHKGVNILIQDLTDSQSIVENIAIFDQTESIILTQPAKSVRLLTNVTNTHYSTEGVDRIKRFSQTVTPHILASAVLGIDGLKKLIVKTLIKLTGRPIQVCNNEAEALDWLAAQ